MAFVGLAGASGFREHPLHHPQLLPPDDAVGAVARTQAVLYVAAALTAAPTPAARETAAGAEPAVAREDRS